MKGKTEMNAEYEQMRNEIRRLHAILREVRRKEAALIESSKDLLAWANIQDTHSPQAVEVRDKVQAAIAAFND
jgi:hypothetical protein